jgi:flagellar biosynthesis component FlhA
MGHGAVILTSSRIRSSIRHLVSRNDPTVTVLSYQEIVPSVKIEQLDVVSFNRVEQGVPPPAQNQPTQPQL